MEKLNNKIIIHKITEAVKNVRNSKAHLRTLEEQWIFFDVWGEYVKLKKEAYKKQNSVYKAIEFLNKFKYSLMLHDKNYSSMQKDINEFILKSFSRTEVISQPVNIKVIDWMKENKNEK